MKRKKTNIIWGEKYIKIAYCKAGVLKYMQPKKIVTLVGVLCLLTSCIEYGMTEEAQKSWEVYCAKYNVSVDHASAEEVNFFLDCYRGSVEEEKDLGLW